MTRLQALIIILALRARDQVELVHMLLVAVALLNAGASTARAIASAQKLEVGHA